MAKGNNGLLGKKRSEETKRKIALGNTGKVFSEERRKAISESRKRNLLLEQINEIKELISLVSFEVLRKRYDISATSLRRILRENGINPSNGFTVMRNVSIEDALLIKKLGEENVFYKEIARQTGRGKKQIYCLLKKYGIKPITKDPNRKINFSKLEERLASDFERLGIRFQRQFPLGNFFFDFRILDTNILVEVHGDFWHANPRVYKKEDLLPLHKNAIKRDFCKKAVAEELGFKRIVSWECDLRNDWESELSRVVEKINEYKHRNI